jgi:DNA polymerase-3 subunit epsilon
MLLAEIYRRSGSWRLRAIGQGYDDGLVELAARYGVEIEKLRSISMRRDTAQDV